ncbi:MAG: 50S ribosomal protein L21 [bacterium]
MYAICQISGRQFRVEPQGILRVPRLQAAEGEAVELKEILFVSDEKGVRFGTPHVDGRVVARVLSHGREKKIIVYKKIRRADYRRKRGHRQDYTEVKIEAIEA